jgi:FkbM family methyltransferase
MFGKNCNAMLRLKHLDSDMQSVLELAVGDRYRLAQLPEPDLIIDGGANTGLFTVAAAARWPNAKIIAFEPVPHNVAMIRRHIEWNSLEDTVEIHEAALANRRGSLDFYLRGANEGSFSSTPGWNSIIKVPLRALHEVLKQKQFCSLLIKLDIEGAEVEVLQGLFEEEISNNVTIVLELHEISRNRGFVENLAVRYGLHLEFFEEAEHTGHCQLTLVKQY